MEIPGSIGTQEPGCRRGAWTGKSVEIAVDSEGRKGSATEQGDKDEATVTVTMHGKLKDGDAETGFVIWKHAGITSPEEELVDASETGIEAVLGC